MACCTKLGRFPGCRHLLIVIVGDQAKLVGEIEGATEPTALLITLHQLGKLPDEGSMRLGRLLGAIEQDGGGSMEHCIVRRMNGRFRSVSRRQARRLLEKPLRLGPSSGRMRRHAASPSFSTLLTK